MDTVRAALEERDLLLFVVDAARRSARRTARAVDLAAQGGDAGGAGAEQDRPAEGQGRACCR